MKHADLDMRSKSTEGDERLVGYFVNGTFVSRGISRWMRNRGYKVSAVCEMVAAREAAGV